MNINIIKGDENKSTPHLAICHAAQGGSANNRHVSLLMKSSEDTILSKSAIEAIKKFGIDNFPEHIQKAFSANTKATLLANALKADYADDDEWLCVEDYTDTTVVFSICDCDSYKLLQTTYNMDEETGKVSIGGSASPVIGITEYMVVEGDIEISETVEHRLESGMYEIVQKAFKRAESDEKIMQVLKAAKKKKEGDIYLTADQYAYVPDTEKVSTWKLRIDDAEHVKAAAQALSPAGLMGNKVQIPSEDVGAVKRKVKAAYKKFYPDADKETLDNLFKASDINNVEVNLENVDITKSVEFQEMLQKALAADPRIAEAQEILKAAETVARDETVKFVKSANFIAEDQQESLVNFLMKSRKTEDHALVQNILKSAMDAIEKANKEVADVKEKFALTESGLDGNVDLSGAEVDLTKAKDFLKGKAESLFKK